MTALRIELIDGQGRNRTADTAIFSRVLYQLSYLAGLNLCKQVAKYRLSRNRCQTGHETVYFCQIRHKKSLTV